jgi:O-antigen ligase
VVLPRTWEASAQLAVLAAIAVGVAYALAELGPAAALVVALLPLIVLAVLYLLTEGHAVLLGVALVLPMSELAIVSEPLVGPVHVQDIVAALALGAWIYATLMASDRFGSIPRTPVLGWPLVLFGAATFVATVRGHYAYGASLLGQPLRFVLYAAIVAGLLGLTARGLHRLLIGLFYPGTIFVALTGLYYVATGGTGVGQHTLSTGGERLISITTSLYCAAALFLALLTVQLTTSARMRAVHLSVAALAAFGVVTGFGRAVYTAVALVCVLLFVTSHRLRGALLSVVPLALPLIVVLAIGANQAAPNFIGSVVARLASSPENDANVQWRLEANRAVLQQVREDPLFGVGFGRSSEFFLTVESRTTGLPSLQPVDIGQDPHNGYVYLLAGGGAITLAFFLLLLAVFARDAVRRYRIATDPTERLIILWACATLFAFLVNAASAPIFALPESLLTLWVLLVIPAVVVPTRANSSQFEIPSSRTHPTRSLTT